MKIDWSKWTFKVSDVWSTDIIIVNKSDDTYLRMNIKPPTVAIDDVDKYIKEQCKIQIAASLVNSRLRQLHDKTLPVEDNLDYIENEAEKRGLI